MSRHTRYQGAIVRDDQILLIRHTRHATGRSYWIMPGGGIEPGESEAACVRREMQEETCVEVAVRALILDEPAIPGGSYQRHKTYLCDILSGEPQPGYEPEVEAANQYGITEVAWFDLREPTGSDARLANDPQTAAIVGRIQNRLGYEAADGSEGSLE